MTFVFNNFAQSILVTNLTIAGTVVAIEPSKASKFPAPTGIQKFALTLFDGIQEPEIVWCTSNPGTGNLTVTRARESTSAKAWQAGTKVYATITAAMLDAIPQSAGTGFFINSGELNYYDTNSSGSPALQTFAVGASLISGNSATVGVDGDANLAAVNASIQNSAGKFIRASALLTEWVTKTAGSELARIRLLLQKAGGGVAEVFRLTPTSLALFTTSVLHRLTSAGTDLTQAVQILVNSTGNKSYIGLSGTDKTASVNFNIENSAGNNLKGAAIEVICTDDTPGLEAYELRFVTKTAAGSEVFGRIDSQGNFRLGSPLPIVSGVNSISRKGTVQSDPVLAVHGDGAPVVSLAVLSASGSGANGAASAIVVQKNSATNRAINAGGTINASGADYAEYEKKNPDCGVIYPGDVAGKDSQGLLTTLYADAVSFLVKSTNPSLVGGDSWGDVLGQIPTLAPRGRFETQLQFETRQSVYQQEQQAYQAALEVERVKYDRMAYCGKTPLNHNGQVFNVGDYAVPVQSDDFRIMVIFKSPQQITFSEYLSSVGIVVQELADGRPLINVNPIAVKA